MGKGSSSNRTVNNTENTSGANQVNGNNNLSLSGIRNVGDVTFTDFGSVGKSLDNMLSLSSDVVKSSEGLALAGMNGGFDFAEKNQNFMTDILDKYQKGVSNNADKAFNAIGTNTQKISDAFTSESYKQTVDILDVAKVGLFVSGVAYAVSQVWGK